MCASVVHVSFLCVCVCVRQSPQWWTWTCCRPRIWFVCCCLCSLSCRMLSRRREQDGRGKTSSMFRVHSPGSSSIRWPGEDPTVSQDIWSYAEYKSSVCYFMLPVILCTEPTKQGTISICLRFGGVPGALAHPYSVTGLWPGEGLLGIVPFGITFLGEAAAGALWWAAGCGVFGSVSQ